MSLEHVDVLIVGAGLSGIAAAYRLQSRCPQKTYTILEARGGIGGTWDLFRYPGIRSDSDMYTLGYPFKPWGDVKSIADGQSILDYVREAAHDHGIEDKIRFHHRVVRSEWSSASARWMVEAKCSDTHQTARLSCSFLLICSGYYRYDEGYTPDFEGIQRFGGRIVHPQQWTDDVEYAGKRVVVIGSGATAVTLVPAMAQAAQHLTMLQRSPSYIVALPQKDPLARLLRCVLPMRAVFPIVRWKNVLLTLAVFHLSRHRPGLIKFLIRKSTEKQLPAGYDVETHFSPTYNPWDQRMCLAPDGDFFRAIRDGSASVITDHIDMFTEKGLKLASGTELEADLVITATGLNLSPLGGMQVVVDGREIDLGETMTYRGMMISGIPNMAFAFGYDNISWTLKSDLTCEYVCRLLNHMDQQSYRQCTPQNRDPSLIGQPFLYYSSSYVLRAINRFPRQGPKAPWRLEQNYVRDALRLRLGPIEDGTMQFSHVDLA
ncbi:MAG TPA: NAD(P)/FAD-dependent oxidoreductase [Solirubrobacteraceae bacterium]|jgi:cation diffusion facilitator CzcD-associated flavoprotein CzcO